MIAESSLRPIDKSTNLKEGHDLKAEVLSSEADTNL